ncbi:MAG: hypothetical protein ABII71_00300 [Candidatus Micrarchaeota archaeon]
MRAFAFFMFLVLLSSAAFAAILTSGDGGAEWAQVTAREKCQEENVGAVYLCLGNVVRVVSTVPGAGSTFYEPDGNIARCPLVSPSEMGAECVQMTMPNYCPDEVVCGEAEEHVFPGHSDYEAVMEPEEAPEPTPEPEVPEPALISSDEPEDEPAPQKADERKTTKPETVTDESIFSNLAFMVLVLGVVAILVIYFLFRRTTGR